nr:MAG TPA: hypothetical protein [Caudoviricetes sp.]
MELIELKEQAGYMYINATHRIIAYFVYCPDTDARLWVLTPEEEALALEAKWRKEDDERLKRELESN